METFVEKHKFDVQDESWFRCEWFHRRVMRALTIRSDMAYYDEFTPEDEAKVKGLWLKGHQDHGCEQISDRLVPVC